jgi:ABC-type multidrug transport system fused ATPase/permease subunit
MLSINFQLALVAFSTIPIVLIISYFFRIKARKIQRQVKKRLARINATLAENINGMSIIQIFNQENYIYKAFKRINEDYFQASLNETKLYAIFKPSMNLIYSISLALIIWYGGGLSINQAIELGVLVAFIQYLNQFFRPIFDLAEKFNIFQSAMASSERVFMLLDEPIEIKDPKNPVKLPKRIEGQIKFENVYFSYDTEDNYVLKNVSFEVNPGETIALVGATGSGKTTITSLINRFYDIQKGKITIDGIDLKDIKKEDLREHIGMVLQDVFLFAGDIKSNIRLNNEDITLKEIEEVSKYVNAHDFITSLENDYHQEVTERGSTLSTGQRQLLSFARALAFDPDVLILDEATSNIDTHTELLIQNAIEKLIRGRTTIIVAHRLSTIKNADKIIVLHQGKIMEMGTHNELIEKGKMYYDLYKLQYID